MIIIPSVLSNNPEEVRQMLTVCEDSVNRVQIDIHDGSFLGEKTIEPEILVGFDTNLDLDFHLMVKEPIHWVEKCVRAGADRIIAQIENMASQVAFVKKVQEVNLQVGLALDIETPVDSLDKSVITDLDVILLMDYRAGEGGQAFNEKVLEKITDLSKIKNKDPNPFLICCDGAIWLETIPKVAKLGVDEVAIGGRLFAGDIKDNMNKLLSAI